MANIIFPTQTIDITPALDDRFLVSDTSNGGAASDFPISALPVSTPQQTALDAKEDKANKGQPNGYASLDGSGKVPIGQIPAGIGTGNVIGPASSTDNGVARFDGTTGKIIQDSNVTIDDTTGDVTGGKYNGVAVAGSSSPVLNVTGTANVSGTNTGNETASSIAAINHGAPAKTALVDADEVEGQNSASSFSLIRTTWSDVKTFLKTYFDTLYVGLLGNQTIGGIKTFSSTIVGSINGNAATVTTNANLTGDVTSVGNATTLANTAVTPGTYTFSTVTVDSKGRVTSASSGSASSGFEEVRIQDYMSTGIIGILGQYDATRTGTLVEVTIVCDTLPVGSNLIGELRKNSTISGNVLSTTLQVTTTESLTNGKYTGATPVTTFSSSAIADGDVFYVYLTSVGSPAALNPRVILRYT